MSDGNEDKSDDLGPTKLAVDWWHKNQWFNQPGGEKMTFLARAIDICLDEEGYDKETHDYYRELDNRLKIIGSVVSKLQNHIPVVKH
jgi:hypothetical protein